jgi:hypothetical protein
MRVDEQGPLGSVQRQIVVVAEGLLDIYRCPSRRIWIGSARALEEIRQRPGCSSVASIAINRITDDRAESNWSMCVVSGGRCLQAETKDWRLRRREMAAKTAFLLASCQLRVSEDCTKARTWDPLIKSR